MCSTRTWCGSTVWSRASMCPSRKVSTSSVSIPRTYADRPVLLTWGLLPSVLAATVVGTRGVGGPGAPVAPVAGDRDRGPGVPERVVGSQGGPVAAVDLPVAEVVGRAVRELPPAGLRHRDLGRHERLAPGA